MIANYDTYKLYSFEDLNNSTIFDKFKWLFYLEKAFFIIRKEMKDFFKYLHTNPEDEQWGLSLNVVGKTSVDKFAEYPSREHPNGYFFSWKTGRTLSEYQINYITEGSGILETKNGKYKVEAGTIMLIRNGVWHRYKPFKETGWTENYIGIKGDIADRLFQNKILSSNNPLIKIGLKEEFIDYYYRIFDLTQKEKPGFQMLSSGLAMQILGYIVSFEKNKQFIDSPLDTSMEKAKYFMRSNLDHNINFEELAQSLNLGYSYFRRIFKKHTGVSPGQYHLHLRLMRAKELLLTTESPVKEIAYNTGFESTHYFSRLFKTKMGISPSEVRNGS